MTGLARKLKAIIETEGPIPFDRYMQLCLGDPEFGYYITRDPFGADGDFTTAPEISQMFGELVGLWAAETWSRHRIKGPVRLVELGPGRGTLMADALRACRVAPDFLAAVEEICLVETSPILREKQEQKLQGRGVNIRWCESVDDVPPGPAIFIANEFFDALPVRHFIRVEEGWCEKLVGVDEDGNFFAGLAAEPEQLIRAEAPVGSILEICATGHKLAAAISARIVRQGGAALIIDYGHIETAYGETVQALRRHVAADPLTDPGESDITAHVDFASLARAAAASGAVAFGPITQADFLNRIGVVQRAKALRASGNPVQAANVDQELRRLTSSDPEIGAGGRMVPGMGDLFKVIAIQPSDAPTPAGFEQEAADSNQ
ncbi:MAG: SAM-dependent methyltransferase [Beijerinckiaceae bacterium]|nr:SAM-dependent methyltransferase [Beijerinckiaceae bacterium]